MQWGIASRGLRRKIERLRKISIFGRGVRKGRSGRLQECCKPFKILLQEQWQVLAVYRGFSCLVLRKSRCRRGRFGADDVLLPPPSLSIARQYRRVSRDVLYCNRPYPSCFSGFRRVQATPRTLGKSPQGTCPFYGNRHCYPFQRPRIPRPPARNPAPAKNPRSVRKKLRSGGEVPIVFGIFI